MLGGFCQCCINDMFLLSLLYCSWADMTHYFLEEQQIVLEIIAASLKPLGWYGIEIRLGMRGIILEATITTLLRLLENEAHILHITGHYYLHDIYELTPSGRDYLNHLSHPNPRVP